MSVIPDDANGDLGELDGLYLRTELFRFFGPKHIDVRFGLDEFEYGCESAGTGKARLNFAYMPGLEPDTSGRRSCSPTVKTVDGVVYLIIAMITKW